MKAIVLAALALCANPSAAQPPTCKIRHCAVVFHLQSVSAAKSYGILVQAPTGGCRRVRYSVRTAAAVFLGHSPTLGPGEVAVVRMGRGFAEGDHTLTIAAEGCSEKPLTARKVTLAKAAPDHGWRAARVVRPSFPSLPTW